MVHEHHFIIIAGTATHCLMITQSKEQPTVLRGRNVILFLLEIFLTHGDEAEQLDKIIVYCQ